MKAFNILVTLLSGYVLTIAFGVISLEAFTLAVMNPIQGYHALVQQHEYMEPDYHPSFHIPERTDNKGVTAYDTRKSYKGYTFYIGAGQKTAFLTNINGDITHSWNIRPKEIWADDKEHSAHHSSDHLFSSRRAFLVPDTGEIYAIISSRTGDFKARSLVKLDKNSNVVWVYKGSAHHDLTFSNNKEHLYTLNKTTITQRKNTFPDLAPPYLDEAIIVLNQQGQEIKQISLFDLFEESPFKTALERIISKPADPTMPDGDILHSNTIEVVSKDAAGKAPMLKEGHLMVSFRNLDLLIMVDPDKEEITWASYGPWKGQHDPEIQNDGSVIMFDNQGSFKKDSGTSRILQVDLNTMEILWEYNGTKENPLSSAYNSSIHVLPNSNILVTETEAGRIFEVTRDKEIVWEYWNPKRRLIEKSHHGEQYNNTPHMPSLFSAERYTKDELKFLADIQAHQIENTSPITEEPQ